MLRRILDWRIRSVERALGVPLDEVRFLSRVSLRTLWRYFRFARLNDSRGCLPADAWAVASIAGALADDCGACVQIGARLGMLKGVKREIVRAAALRQPERLPEALREVFEFGEAVTLGVGDLDALRERIRLRYGDAGLADLALVIGMHRVFGTFKRGLGYHTSCALTPIEV